jgi:predicted nucleotidyltransferase
MIFRDSILTALSTRVKVRIVRHFLSGPPKMSEREIAKELKMSHMSVNRAVNELYSMNFLRSSRAGKVNLWEVNEGSFSYETIKKLLSEYGNAMNPLIDLKKTIVTSLKGQVIHKAVLYGSVAKSKETPGSDLDLFIITGSDNDKLYMVPALEKLEKLCISLYGNPLSPYVLTLKEYRERRLLPVIKQAEAGMLIIGKDTIK